MQPKTGSNSLPVLGIVLLGPPAYFVARWVRITREVANHDDRVAEFGSIFPRVLQDPLASTLLALVCAAATVAISAAGVNRFAGPRRWLCVATLGIGGLLSLWLVWSLL